MANEKSVYKKLICPKCGYNKHDSTGKSKEKCPKCDIEMRLSANWTARTMRDGVDATKGGFSRKQDAIDYLAECKRAARLGVLQPGKEKDIRWEQAGRNCKKWWEEAVVTGNLSQKAADFYKYRMKNLDRFFTGKTLLGITKGDVKDYQVFRSKEGVGPTTINHEKTTLRRVYTLHTSERTSEDKAPQLFAKARDIGSAANLKKVKGKVRFLNVAEIKALLGNASTPMIHTICLLALNTGLRRGNILNLTWKQVSLQRGVIDIPGSEMKNGKDHTIEISPQIVALLKRWQDKQLIQSEWVFPNYNGKSAYDKGSLTQQWKKTMDGCRLNVDTAGVPVPRKDTVTFHTLRHTYASQFLMDGGDLVTLSELLAHANISITKDVYGHLSREHRRQAVNTFATNFLDQFV